MVVLTFPPKAQAYRPWCYQWLSCLWQFLLWSSLSTDWFLDGFYANRSRSLYAQNLDELGINDSLWRNPTLATVPHCWGLNTGHSNHYFVQPQGRTLAILLDSNGISTSNKRTNLPKATQQPVSRAGVWTEVSLPVKAIFLLCLVLLVPVPQSPRCWKLVWTWPLLKFCIWHL